MSPRSLLVISAAPDGRFSPATLVALVAELRRRPGLRTSLWLLHRGDGETVAAERFVEDLRTGQPAAWLQAVGVSSIAGWLRDRKLQRWWRLASPDAVVLDDGRGARVIAGHPAVVLVNTDVPSHDMQGGTLVASDLQVMPDGVEPIVELALGESSRFQDLHDVLEFCSGTARWRVRRRLGLPADDLPLVVGWGSDVWFDGVDVFVRSLWALEHVHGVVARGLWIGLDAAEDEVERLTSEARRCGLGDRITYVPAGDADARFCGDVVLLPYRSDRSMSEHLDEILVTGAQIVVTTAVGVAGRGITVVDDLDAYAAGQALACCIADDRDAVAADLGRTYLVVPLVDELIRLTDENMSHA